MCIRDRAATVAVVALIPTAWKAVDNPLAVVVYTLVTPVSLPNPFAASPKSFPNSVNEDCISVNFNAPNCFNVLTVELN